MARTFTLKPARFITSILTIGALIATLAAAAPAHAGDRDKARVVLGTVATIWLLHEMNKNGQRQDKYHKADRGGHDGNRNRGGYGNGHRQGGASKVYRKPALPGRCLRDTRRQGQVLGANCLNRHYRAANALPGACRTTFRNNGQRRNGFNYGCLRSRGYQIARR